LAKEYKFNKKFDSLDDIDKMLTKSADIIWISSKIRTNFA